MLSNFNITKEKMYEIKNHLFSIAWCMLLIQVLIYNSTFPAPPFNITLLSLLLLGICAIFPFDYKPMEIIVIFIGGLFTLLLLFKMKTASILWIYAFIVCSKGISLKPLFKKTLFIYVGFFILCFILSQMGIIRDAVRTTGGTGRPKHSLGFVDANGTHSMFVIMVALTIALYYNKMKLWHFGVIFIVNYLLYTLTVSRTGMLIVSLVLIIAVGEKLITPYISDKFHNFLCISMIAVLFFCIAVFSFGPMIADKFDLPFINKALSKLNDIVTGRIYISRSFFKEYGLPIFGTYVSQLYDHESRWAYMDVGYIVLMIHFGFVYYLFFVTSYIRIFIRFFKEHNFGMLLAITAILLHMTNENTATLIFFNFSYFFFRDFIFRDKKPAVTDNSNNDL